MMEIREAEIRDVPAVVSLWKRLMALHLPYHESYRIHDNAEKAMENHLRKVVGAKDFGFFVAVERAEVVGYALVSIQSLPPVYTEKLEARLTDLFVSDSERSKGVGSKLLSISEKWASGKGIRQMTLETDQKNSPAIHTYLKNGFEPYRIKMIKRI